jgi:hypothetical protein
MLGALIATVSGAHPTTPYSLNVGGLNVLLPPTTGGNRSGVPIESIRVSEAGPNGVSSMTFRIEDPQIAITMFDGLDVRFHNHTLDVPVFLGFVQSFDQVPDFGNQGRSFIVTAVGIEAVLDWAKTTAAVTYANTPGLGQTVQAIVASCVGLGPIRDGDNNLPFGNQAYPVAASFIGPLAAFTVPSGTTAREAIRMAIAAYYTIWVGDPSSAIEWAFTVDFYYGLRLWQTSPLGLEVPADFVTETVVDTAASTTNSADLKYAWDAIGAVRGVVVVGTGISLYVTDGTGKMGPIASLSDTTITTAAQAQSAAAAYLTGFVATIRGSYSQTDRVPVRTTHPGGRVTITDAAVGLSSNSFRVMQIDKTFNGSTRENWTVTFGGLPPSGATLLRRLTRDTLS